MAADITAVICHTPDGEPNWRVEKISIARPLKDHEVKVRMTATGICHTDVFFSCLPAVEPGPPYYPKILGHEGAGIVEEIGAAITVASVGDPVLLSFNFCGDCILCNNGRQAHCSTFGELNTFGEKGMFTSAKGEDPAGKFFGQSSFAGTSIVGENCIVNMKVLIKDQSELKILAPLGCGLMTGSGAVLNTAKPKPHDIVMVTGIGAVGLGAVMTARILGCKEIIAVDRVAKRLEIAKQLGATKILDTSGLGADFSTEVQQLVNNERISYVLETTGVVSVVNSSLEALGKSGKLVAIGIPPLGAELRLPFFKMFTLRKTIECHVLGESTGHEMIPKMLQWWRDGKFPVEKLIQYFPADQALDALEGMESGRVIKPVIVW